MVGVESNPKPRFMVRFNRYHNPRFIFNSNRSTNESMGSMNIEMGKNGRRIKKSKYGGRKTRRLINN